MIQMINEIYLEKHKLSTNGCAMYNHDMYATSQNFSSSVKI